MITFGGMEDLSHEQHPRPGYMWRQSSAVKTYVLVPSTELGVTISESGHAAQWSLEQLEAGAGGSDWTWNVSVLFLAIVTVIGAPKIVFLGQGGA